MSTTIKYVNNMGAFVTSQQVASLSSYDIVTYENGIIKTIETFDISDTGTTKLIRYFMQDTEDKNLVIQQYSNESSIVGFRIYLNKVSAFDCNIWNWEEYSATGTLRFKGKETYNHKHWLVASCSFDLLTDDLQAGAVKNFYSNEFETQQEDLLIQIYYKSSGEVDLLFDYNDTFGYSKGLILSEFLADTQFSEQDFPWLEHPYYHAVEPMVPQTPL